MSDKSDEIWIDGELVLEKDMYEGGHHPMVDDGLIHVMGELRFGGAIHDLFTHRNNTIPDLRLCWTDTDTCQALAGRFAKIEGQTPTCMRCIALESAPWVL